MALLKTEDEAKKYAIKINKTQEPTWHCPKRKEICSKECEYFIDAYAIKVPWDFNWYISGFTCGNPLYAAGNIKR